VRVSHGGAFDPLERLPRYDHKRDFVYELPPVQHVQMKRELRADQEQERVKTRNRLEVWVHQLHERGSEQRGKVQEQAQTRGPSPSRVEVQHEMHNAGWKPDGA
jgi:hypothetical protein